MEQGTEYEYIMFRSRVCLLWQELTQVDAHYKSAHHW